MDPPAQLSTEQRLLAVEEECRTYQGSRLARRFRQRIDALRAAEQRVAPDSERLTRAAVAGYARVLMPKDEYEVARLYTDGRFQDKLASTLEGGTLRFHMAPPMLSFLKDSNGRPRKFALGSWMLPLFRVLAKLRGLRGTLLDPLRHTADRRLDAEIIADYERLLDAVIEGVDGDTLERSVELLASVESVRGYGPVRDARYAAWRAELPDLEQGLGAAPVASAVRQMDPRDAA